MVKNIQDIYLLTGLSIERDTPESCQYKIMLKREEGEIPERLVDVENQLNY